MSITYTWKVTGIKKNQDGTVVQTYWKKIGTDENGKEGVFSGATPFEGDPTAEGYVPFESLTEEQVLEWIKPQVFGVYEDHVNEKILHDIQNASVIDAIMPWAPEKDKNVTPTPPEN